MDLRQLAERYHQQSCFWAQEMALELQGAWHENRRRLLRAIGSAPVPMSTSALVPMLRPLPQGKLKSHHTLVSRICLDFTMAHLVFVIKQGRTGRPAKEYTYALTDLGRLVLRYLPDECSLSPSPEYSQRQRHSRSLEAP